MRRKGRRKKEEGRRGTFPLVSFLFLFSYSLLPFSLSACGHSKKEEAGGGKKGDKPDLLPGVDFGSGNTTVFKSKEPTAPISFTVAWKTGGLRAEKGKVETGHLLGVTGELYSNGAKSSSYRADRGDAVRVDKRLTLTGDVVLKSSDGMKSLKAPQAEYHGDLGYVRAMGGVTAEGPFGTLSGVSELWATPDLSLIGTPDMVSQILHIPALLALASQAPQGSPFLQGRDFKLEDAKSGLAQGIKGTKDLRVTLNPKPGIPIKVTLVSENTVFKSAGKVIVLIDGKTEEVKSLTSEGTAEIVQIKPGKKVTMTGTGVDYGIKTGAATGDLELGGRVTIISVSDAKDSAGKTITRTVVAKGDKATAVLYSKPDDGGDPIKSATLINHVTIDVTGTSGHFTGVGDKIVYTPNGTGARAVMTGKLSFGGDSPSYLGQIQGADTATINLSKDGWEDVFLEDTGGGKIHGSAGQKDPPKSGGPR